MRDCCSVRPYCLWLRYDFWVICGAVSIAVAFANASAKFDQATALKYVAIGVVFAVPFLLRQVHVAYVLGATYWLQDFIYSVAIKVPYASSIITIPSLDEIDAYYRAHHVLRPPAGVSNSGLSYPLYPRHMVMTVTVPRWGWLALVILGAVILAAFAPPTRSKWLGRYSARLVVPVTVGVGVGLVVLAPFSLHVYLRSVSPVWLCASTCQARWHTPS